MGINLEQHRGEPSVWDRGNWMTQWDSERWLLSAIAGAVIAAGFRRRSAAGLLLTVGGSALAWWASSAPEQRHAQRARLRSVLPHRPIVPDPVLEASEESFPASDPPSWTPSTGAGSSLPRNHG